MATYTISIDWDKASCGNCKYWKRRGIYEQGDCNNKVINSDPYMINGDEIGYVTTNENFGCKFHSIFEEKYID